MENEKEIPKEELLSDEILKEDLDEELSLDDLPV